MLKKKAFVKKTRRGNIVKVVREHYLRDDITSGTALDPDCSEADAKLSPTGAHYLIIDTNVALHHIDVLEHPAVEDVIIPSIVLQEVKHRNKMVYDRLRRLTDSASGRRFFVFLNEHHRSTYVTQESGESDNDRNDRAIRVAAKWYSDLLEGKMEVVLLSDDVNNRYRAESELGLKAMNVLSYAQSRLDCTELYDIAQTWAQDDMEIDDESGGKNKKQCRRACYPEHLPLSELKSGIQRGIYHQGVSTMRRHCWYCATVDAESLSSTVRIVGSQNINRAVSGDVVVVKVLEEDSAQSSAHPSEDAPDEEETEEAGAVEVATQDYGEVAAVESGAALRYPLGAVVGIIKRNWRSNGYCGSIKPPKTATSVGHTARVVFKPVGRQFPPILIKTAQVHELLGQRIVVGIDAWQPDTLLPTGHYIRKVGSVGNKETETEVLLIENDVQTGPFTPAVHACVPVLPWSLAEPDQNDPHRRDLRHLCICSIDPPGCKDIDDALHVQALSDGNYELGVHIADVTHFVRPETPLDEEAARRSTTVYLVQKAISMLPAALTEEICSLKCQVDRLAFSVLWQVTPDGDLLHDKTMFTKSIIRSRASLSYAEAQARIDDTRLHDDLTQNLRILDRFGKIFRARRKQQGALELASAEVRFQLDSETQDPTDVAIYQTMDTNRMVEEMMLLANNTVAQKILETFPVSACLRRHPPPGPKRFEPLLAALETKDMTLDLSSNKSLAASLDQAVIPGEPYFNTLLRMMTTRCMNEAEYFISGEYQFHEFYHYGLAMELYTHFTSPIRRYADVLVHRLLAAALGIDPVPEDFRDVEKMQSLIQNMNQRHKNAQMASRASASLYTLVYFRNKSVVEEGWITGLTGVKRAGFTVYIQKYGIEGPVFASDAIQGEASGFIAHSSTGVRSKSTQRVYSIFDRVSVRLEVSSVLDYDEELVLSLIEI